jgi:predicted RNase H-like HicB family nuclease
MKHVLQTSFQISILREGNRYIAYAPALDFSTSGASYEEAKRRFAEGVQLFFEEIIKHGTLEEVLQEYGWRKMRFEWKPPIIISQESHEVKVPA